RRVEAARWQHSAGRDRRHQVRTGRRDFRRRRGFHRGGFRRHPERRPGCTGPTMAWPERGGRVMRLSFPVSDLSAEAHRAKAEAKQSSLPIPHPEERGTRVSKDEGPAGDLALRDARRWRAPQGEGLSLFAMTITNNRI